MQINHKQRNRLISLFPSALSLIILMFPFLVISQMGCNTSPPLIIQRSTDSQCPTKTSAVISWDTNEPATSNVVFFISINHMLFAPSPADTTRDSTSHSVTLTGLTPGTNYGYRVKSKNASNYEDTSGARDFTTPLYNPLEISNITLEYVHPDFLNTGIEITWDTNEPATSQVKHYVTDISGLQYATTVDDTLVTNHSVRILTTFWNDGTSYTYRVVSTYADGRVESERIEFIYSPFP